MGIQKDDRIRLQAIFDAAVDGIIVINDRGIIEEINRAACSLFDYTPEEVIGQNISMLMPVQHSVHHNSYISNYVEDRVPKIIGIGRDVNGRKKDGSEFPFWLSVSEVKLNERVIFTGFVHDLSEIKIAEKNLKQLNEDLEKKVVERTYELENVVNQLLSLNKKLEAEINNKIAIQNQLKEREHDLEESLAKEKELGELKSRFVSMASHEFRTPLSTILSSVSLIGKYTTDEQQSQREKHIQKIKNSVTHLTGILNDFLSMNKLEEGKIQAQSEEFHGPSFFMENIEELRAIAKPNQEILLHAEFDEPLIQTDGKILKNIIINLISNAIKYSDEGSEIICHVKCVPHLLQIEVTDQGMGIPEEDQKHLFDRFFRASNAINIEGTGLGLNIVKKYIEMLNGTITFTSKIYEGSTFKVELPITTL
ncbi:MAG: ATP-binding protein [Saprospiraceae bacterium]|jgi:PAS domain S-box-containing protein|nr:ATP-binding protein [Saprospiraceae bacterium]